MQNDRVGRLDEADEGEGVSSANTVSGERVMAVVAVSKWLIKDLR